MHHTHAADTSSSSATSRSGATAMYPIVFSLVCFSWGTRAERTPAPARFQSQSARPKTEYASPAEQRIPNASSFTRRGGRGPCQERRRRGTRCCAVRSDRSVGVQQGEVRIKGSVPAPGSFEHEGSSSGAVGGGGGGGSVGDLHHQDQRCSGVHASLMGGAPCVVCPFPPFAHPTTCACLGATEARGTQTEGRSAQVS